MNHAKEHRGLADMSDETIEKGHQEQKRYQSRFRQIRFFEKRRLAMRAACRRSRHPDIISEIRKIEDEKPKISENSPRKRKEAEDHEAQRDAKKKRREEAVCFPNER